MLEILAAVVSSLRYGDAVKVERDRVTILNQYLFLWEILPHFSFASISKTAFLAKMKKYGFQPQKDQEKIQSKSIQLKASRNHLRQLLELQAIREDKKAQGQQLQAKMLEIKAHLSQKQSGNPQSLFDCLEAISKLKAINRSLYDLNSQERGIFFSNKQQTDCLKLQQSHNSLTLLNEAVGLRKKKKGIPKTVRFFSVNQLENI